MNRSDNESSFEWGRAAGFVLTVCGLILMLLFVFAMFLAFALWIDSSV